MTDITIGVRDASGLTKNMLALVNPDASQTIYHAENAPQRAALLAALATLATSAAQSTSNTHLAKIAAFSNDSGLTPITGSTSATVTVGPFSPALGRSMILTLSGSWSGSVQLVRSTDGGTTKLPLTIGATGWGTYTTNCNEPVWQESEAVATFYLVITRTSGTISYRLAQ